MGRTISLCGEGCGEGGDATCVGEWGKRLEREGRHGWRRRRDRGGGAETERVCGEGGGEREGGIVREESRGMSGKGDGGWRCGEGFVRRRIIK